MASVYGLMLPTGAGTLLVPAAMVAEVVTRPAGIEPVAGAEPWVLGTFGWRNYSVTLVSFERLAAGMEVPDYRRVCVLHPFPGRRAADYAALVVSGEPRSLEVPDTAATGSIPAGISQRFASGALVVNDQTFVIPDFEGLSNVLFPDR